MKLKGQFRKLMKLQSILRINNKKKNRQMEQLIDQ